MGRGGRSLVSALIALVLVGGAVDVGERQSKENRPLMPVSTDPL